jgi:hypothetical protein
MEKNILQSAKFWGVLAAMLLVIVGLVVFYAKQPSNLNTQTSRVMEVHPGLPEGVSFKVLAAGTIPPGFPPELITFPKIIPTQSNINQTPDNTHLVVQYTAPASPNGVLVTYFKNLPTLEWKLITTSGNGPSAYAQFTKNGGTATITILPTGTASTSTSSLVSVDYITPKKQ